MRIFGDLLLALGIIFLILFILAAVGGGDMGYAPFLVAAVLIATGANLRSSGQGLLRARPEAATGTTSAAGAAGAKTPSTPPEFSVVEMPMTPEVAAAVATQGAHYWRDVKRVILFFFAFFVALGIVIDVADKDVTQKHIFLFVFIFIGVATAIMIGGISWLTVQRPVRRDLTSKSYLRATGPLRIVDISGGAILRLADRSFIVNGNGGVAQLRDLDWGTVDYSSSGHVILGAWDNTGKSVYRLAGYSTGVAVANA